MTQVQKTIISKLLDGHHIGVAGAGLIRLRDSECRPVLKVSYATFDWLNKWDLLHRRKNRWVINRKTIRSLHGNSAIKRLYKGKPGIQKVKNTPP